MKPCRHSRISILTTLVIPLTILIATGGVTPAAGASGSTTEEANGRLRVTANLALALSETPTAIPTETPTATPTLTATDTPTPTDTPTATPTDTPSSITFNPPSLSFDTGSSGTVEVTVNDPDAAVVTSLTVGTAEGLTVTETSRLNVTSTLIQAYTVASSAPGPYTLTFTATFDQPAKTSIADLAVSVNAVAQGIINPTAGIVVSTKRGAPIAGYTIINPDGSTQRPLLQISNSTAEIFTMLADFNGDGIDSVLVSTGARDQGLTHGAGSAVSIHPLSSGVDVPSMVPFPFQHPTRFDNNPTGEVRIAAGNLMGDAPDELIVIQGANAQSRLRICGVQPDGSFTNMAANSFRPNQLANPSQGIKVITADLDNDGYDEIVAAHASKVDFGTGRTGNYMQAMNVADPSTQSMTEPIPGTDIVWAEKQQIFGDNSNPSGGLSMAAGDLDGDGDTEVVVVTAAPNPSDPAHRGNSKLTILVPSFTDSDFANGSFSTMKDNSGAGENICLRLFSEATNPSGDISVSVADLDGDGRDEIVVSRGISIGETVAKSDVTVFYFDEAGIGAGVLNRLPKIELPQVYSSEENPGGGANVAASAKLPFIDETSAAHLFTIPISDLPSGARPLEMALIPSGTFLMGSPIDERWRNSSEAQHEVTLTQAFYFGVHEVTQGQWETVMKSNPSRNGRGLNYPVSYVNWDDCQAFIKRLNGMGLGTFRLPTEAEWEYACRAGTDTVYSFGNALQCSNAYAYCDLMDEYMWWSRNNTYRGNTSGPKQVGMKLPNRWGLYDTHGNVYEWCSDYYGAYSSSPIIDPKGHPTGIYRVLRSGTWSSNTWCCRSAFRTAAPPDSRHTTFGFRLVREYP